MKKIHFFLTALILFSAVSFSQGQFQHPLQWERILGGTNSETSSWSLSSGGVALNRYLVRDFNNNIYLLTASFSGSGGDKNTLHCGNVNQPDYWLVKMDPMGTIIWEKNIGGQNLDMPSTLLLDEARYCMYLVGSSKSPLSCSKTDTTNGKEDIWIVKLDWNGNIIWDKSYGGLEVEGSRAAILTEDGKLFNIGYSTSYLAGGGDIPQVGISFMADMWGFMIDSSGAILWNRWIGADAGWELIGDAYYKDGKIILVGRTNAWLSGSRDVTSPTHGMYDGLVIVLDTNGVNMWNRTLGSVDDEYFVGGYMDNHQNVYVAASIKTLDGNPDITDSLIGGSDVWLVKLDSLGNIVDDIVIGGDSTEFVDLIAGYEDKLYLKIRSWSGISGDKTEPCIDGPDDWIVALDTSLNVLWDETINVTGYESIDTDLLTTSDSGLVFAKFVTATSGGDFTLQCWDTINNTGDLWLMKFAPVTTTGVNPADIGPATLLSCYPNPSTSYLELGRVVTGPVELYTLQGQQIGSWILQSGESEMTLPTENLPDGMYIVRNGNRQCRVVKM